MSHAFTIPQQSILSLLSAMQPICSKRTTLDATEYILFQITARELTLKATDLEVSLQSTADIESASTDSLSFLVQGRRIFDLVKEMSGDITFTASGGTLKLEAGSVHLSLNIKDADDFPPFPERIENLMQIDASFLVSLLNKVSFLTPTNNSNNALNGVLFEIDPERLSLVSTDGHSLAHITTGKYTLPEARKWLLPKRAVLEIKKIIEVNQPEYVFLGVCGNQLVFSGQHFNFFTKLIGDSFPEYRQVLSREGFRPARVSRSDFSRTLKRTGCLLAGQFLSATFAFSPEKLSVDMNNKEVGSLSESLVLGEYAGEEVKARFYSPYLLNGLQVLPDEQVSLHINNSIKPIIFTVEKDEYSFTYLVMPVSAVQSHGS